MKNGLKCLSKFYFKAVILITIINISTMNADAASTITVVTKKVGIDNLNILAGNVLKFILSIAGGIALVVIIVGSVKYITATGDEQSISSAKKTISWAIFGLILILLAYVLSSIIYSLLI
jgi:hypothetical protein